MARRWYNEDYRKLYTRQDGPWLALPACARALASDLIKYADDDAVVAVVGTAETPAQAIAGVIRAKAHEAAWVEEAVTALLDDRYLIRRGKQLVIRNYIDAQERLSQDAVRKRRQRDKETRDSVTHPGNGRDKSVTGAGQEPDKAVTDTVTSPVTVTPNVTPLSAVSRRDETRREKPLAGDAQAPGRAVTTWTAASLEELWVRTYKLAAGNPGDCIDLSRLLRQTADARGEDPEAFAGRFLVANREMLADWRSRNVHHGDPEMVGAIEHFAKVIGWLDRGGVSGGSEAPAGPLHVAKPLAGLPSREESAAALAEHKRQQAAARAAQAAGKATA